LVVLALVCIPTKSWERKKGYIQKKDTPFRKETWIKLSPLQFSYWEGAVFKIFPKAPDANGMQRRHFIYWKPLLNCYSYAHYAYMQGIIAMLTIPSI